MRRFEGMRLPPGVDKGLRKELLKTDRFLKQLQSAVSRSLTKTNLPTAIVTAGAPGVPGPPSNMPDHKHSGTGQGGNVLGLTTGTINGRGFWNFNEGLGAGAVQTTSVFVNISKTYDVPLAAVQGLKTAITLTNMALNGGTVTPHELSSTVTMTDSGVGVPSEVRNLYSNFKISNTADDLSPGAIWTNTSYLTNLNTAKNLYQLIGNRVSVRTLVSGGNVEKFEAYAMDNAWFLAAGKSITDLLVFSCPSPKVFTGNGITNMYALKIDGVAGVIGSLYGMKMDEPTGTITNKWGWHISGAAVKSYHQGKIGINDTTPTAMLDITSDAAATPVLNAVGASAQSADWISLLNNAGNSVGLKVPNSGLTTHSYVLPSAQGASGSLLKNDGSGNLSWDADRVGIIRFNPTDFQQLNGTVAPTSATTTSATPKGYVTFVLVDAPAAGPQAFTTQFVLPQDYVSGTAIEVWLHWTMTVASGADLTWVFRYHYIARGNKEDIDGTWTTTSDTLVDNGLTGSGGDYDVGIANYHAVTRIATDIPSTGLAAGKTIFLTIDRLTTDAADTLNRNIAFLGLELRYTAALGG